jgi:hypothetical protein
MTLVVAKNELMDSKRWCGYRITGDIQMPFLLILRVS